MNKEDYAYYKGLGICLVCLSEKALPDLTLCAECRERKNKHEMSIYYKRKKAGMCVDCGKKKGRIINNGKRRVLCLECNKKKLANMRDNRVVKILSNKCITCGGVVLNSSLQNCESCRQDACNRKMTNYNRHKQAGECVRCGKKLRKKDGGFYSCLKCREKHRKSRAYGVT